MSRWPLTRSLRPGQIRADQSEEIRDELKLYLELRTEELMREGFSLDQAREIAQERFGDRSRIEVDLRRQARRRRAREGGMMTMRGLGRDLSLRHLNRPRVGWLGRRRSERAG